MSRSCSVLFDSVWCSNNRFYGSAPRGILICQDSLHVKVIVQAHDLFGTLVTAVGLEWQALVELVGTILLAC